MTGDLGELRIAWAHALISRKALLNASVCVHHNTFVLLNIAIAA
jgi:hypothetical protein